MDGTPGKASTISRYTLIEELGRGGMGAVWRAKDGAGREVALKLLRAGWGEADLRRFQREAALASQLTHEGIVKVLDWGTDRGTPFIAMELVPGESLERRIASRGPVPPREAAAIALALSRALAHAHARSVLHRDVKPANVLLDPLGRAHLVDFGVARPLRDAEGGLTRTGELVGTPATMAPEQARGLRELDGRVDVYGVGVTLFVALSGRLPFEGDSWIATLQQVLTLQAPALAPLVPGLDPALEAICLRCLEKDPTARFPGARELATALASWLEGRPRRSRRIAVGSLALAASLGAALVLVGRGRDPVLPSPPVAATVPITTVELLRRELAREQEQVDRTARAQAQAVGEARLRLARELSRIGASEAAAAEWELLLESIERTSASLEGPPDAGELREHHRLLALRASALRGLGRELPGWLASLPAREVAGLGLELKNQYHEGRADPSVAVEVLRWLVASHRLGEPASSSIHFALGGVLFAVNDWEGGLAAYERCVADDYAVWARFRRAEGFIQLRQLESAREELALDPAALDVHCEGWALLARVHAMLGDDAASLEAVERLRALPDAGDALSYKPRAGLYRLMGLVKSERWSQARALLPELEREAASAVDPWKEAWKEQLQELGATIPPER